MAEIQEQAEDFQEALGSLLQAKLILEANYGEVDKRTCKVKRNISLLFLKSNQYEMALDELRQVEVSLKSVYHFHLGT